MTMKRKILKDSDCYCGSGWQSEDSEHFECPYCYQEIEIPNNSKTMKCPECNNKIIIERGIQYLIRVKEC